MKLKGFTLVEVIVVLLILAILSAVMIPALTGWIDETRAQECRSKMGMVARDYHVCVANEGYGKLGVAIDPNALLNRAVMNILSESANGAGYVCPYGGACAVAFGDGNLSIASITCNLHGSMTFGTGGAVALNNGEIAGGIQNALFDGKPTADQQYKNKTFYGNGSDQVLISTAYPTVGESLNSLFKEKNILNSLQGKSWKLYVNSARTSATLYVYDRALTEADYEKKIEVQTYTIDANGISDPVTTNATVGKAGTTAGSIYAIVTS